MRKKVYKEGNKNKYTPLHLVWWREERRGAFKVFRT